METDQLRKLAEVAGYEAPFLVKRPGKIYLWTTGENGTSWRPHEDMNQAMEAADGLARRGWRGSLHWMLQDGYCLARFVKDGLGLSQRPIECRAFEREQAICLAALKVMEAECVAIGDAGDTEGDV